MVAHINPDKVAGRLVCLHLRPDYNEDKKRDIVLLMADSLRRSVLSLYRRILRTGFSWESQIPSETKEEKTYIITEAKRLFKANKTITDVKVIEQHILEGEARLEIALHYKNPYPRPVNMPPNTISKGRGRRNMRRQEISRPVYVKSIDNET